MQWVEIRDTMARDGQTVVAKCILNQNGTVSVQTDDSNLERQLNAGILDKTSGSWTPVTPNDGFRFLKALTSVFRSGSRWATKILTDESAPTAETELDLPNAA